MAGDRFTHEARQRLAEAREGHEQRHRRIRLGVLLGSVVALLSGAAMQTPAPIVLGAVGWFCQRQIADALAPPGAVPAAFVDWLRGCDDARAGQLHGAIAAQRIETAHEAAAWLSGHDGRSDEPDVQRD